MRKTVIFLICVFVLISTIFCGAMISYSSAIEGDFASKIIVDEDKNKDKIINFYDGDILIESIKTKKYKDKNVMFIKCVPTSKVDKMFVGWVRDNDDTVYKNGMIIAVKDDVDFYAKYEDFDIDQYLNDDEDDTYEEDLDEDLIDIATISEIQ